MKYFCTIDIIATPHTIRSTGVVVGGGSGPSYLSGWITCFCVFSEECGWLGDKTMFCDLLMAELPKINDEYIPSGIVNVPIMINDNGKEYKTRMLAGSLMCSLPNQFTLQPRLDFCLAKLLNINKILFPRRAVKKDLEIDFFIETF